MTVGRTTQVVAETLVEPSTDKARTTQVVAEALLVPAALKARTTHVAAETLVLPSITKARTTEVAVEVLVFELKPIRFTDVVEEVAVLPTSQKARFTDVVEEVAVLPTSQLVRVTDVVEEVAVLLTGWIATPFPLVVTYSMPTPALTYGVPIDVVPLVITYSMPVPSLGFGFSVAAVPLVITYSMPIPIVEATLVISAPPLEVTYSLPVPGIRTGFSVSAVPLIVTTSLPTSLSTLIGFVIWSRPFGLSGFGTLSWGRPFALLNDAITYSWSRSFRLLSSPIQVYVPPAAVSTTLAVAATIGQTSIQVTSAASIASGQFLMLVGGEVVQVGSGYTTGTTIPLVAPLIANHALGSAVVEAGAAQPFFLIFDKAGAPIGVLDDVYISAAPSHAIGQQGNCVFWLPRNATNESMVKSDRLVVIGDPYGQPWAGAIEPITWDQSEKEVEAPDLFSLMDMPITLNEIVPDNTLATDLYRLVIDTFNAAKSDAGEIQFAVDYTGSKTFKGDLIYDGTVKGALDLIAGRSDTEHALRITIASGRLVPFHVVRDRFAVAGGALLHDGDNGNIFDQPSYRTDPTSQRSSVRIIGETTDIASLLPDWARWAVHEISPESLAAGTLPDADSRQRQLEEVVVSWSLSKAEQQRLADLTLQIVTAMYYSFIYAVHDQWGRPWHEGWAYIGMPDNMIPELTKDKWNTSLMLVEVKPDVPGSQVMRSGPFSLVNGGKRLVVLYDRATGIQTVVQLLDSQVGASVTCTATIPSGQAKTLWDLISGKVRAGGSYVGPASFTVGNPVTLQIALPIVTYRYGGQPVSRGLFNVIVTCKVRSSPYLRTDNVVRTAYSGETFAGRQSTYYGSSLNGSRLWHGNFNGTEWVHDSWVRVDGHNTSSTGSFRLITSGPNEGKYILSAGLTVVCVSSGAAVSPYITKIYPFEKALISQWDPRREGIGLFSRKPSIEYGSVTTRARWNFVSFDAGAAATSLDTGLNTGDISVLVKSDFGFPETTGFVVTVGDPNEGSAAEDMLVTGPPGLGPLWTVERGYNSTPIVIHEAGEPVVLKNPPVWDGFVFDWSWADGDQVAADTLAELLNIREVFQIPLDAGTQVELGSIHTLELATEGPWPAGITRSVRVVGFARDTLEGTMSVVVETEP